MGTRGYIVYYYAGRYYVFYNHRDSYPSSLGLGLTNQVPQDADQYQEWLMWMRERLQAFEDEIDTELYSTTSERIQNYTVESATQPWEEISFDGLHLEKLPGICPPSNDIWIEWVYIFDLEAEQFLVSGHYGKRSYALHAIDRADLIQDEHGEEISDAGEQPELEESTEDRAMPDVHGRENGGPDGLGGDNDGWDLDVPERITPTRVSVVKPDTKRNLPKGLHSALLVRKAVAEGFASWVINEFLDEHRVLTRQDRAFREVCYVLASLACGGEDTFHLYHQNEPESRSQQSLGVLNAPIKDDNGFYASLETGWHAPGEPSWLCPRADIFLIGAVLVLPWPSIWDPLNEEAALRHLMCYATEQDLQSFHAIILSIGEVTLIQFRNGNLKKTRPIALIPDPRFVMPAGVDDATDCLLALTIFSECAQLDRLAEGSTAPGPPSFSLSTGRECDLPAEIWLEVLKNVSPDTRRSLAQVSRFLRSCVQEYTYLFHGYAAIVDQTDSTTEQGNESQTPQHVQLLHTINHALPADPLAAGKYKVSSIQKAPDHWFRSFHGEKISQEYWLPLLRSPKSNLYPETRAAYIPDVRFSLTQHEAING